VQLHGKSDGYLEDICRLNIRASFFSARIVSTWNSLPDSIVTAPSVNAFKNRLDTFWANLPSRYDTLAVRTQILTFTLKIYFYFNVYFNFFIFAVQLHNKSDGRLARHFDQSPPGHLSVEVRSRLVLLPRPLQQNQRQHCQSYSPLHHQKSVLWVRNSLFRAAAY
jgi:hypothetical protein